MWFSFIILLLTVNHDCFPGYQSKAFEEIKTRLYRNSKLDIFSNDINLFYVKTHKTASTTTQNIFFRIAENYNMKKSLLLLQKHIWVNWPYPFYSNKLVTNLKERRKVFAQHVRFKSKNVEAFFPRESSFYVTTIRNPVSQLLSAINFFNPSREKYQVLQTLNNSETRDKFIKTSSFGCIYSNPNTYDLGYTSCGEKYNGTTEELLTKIRNDFDLVILQDYYLEGLILLKQRLNLSYMDIIYLKAKQALDNRNKTIPLGSKLAEILSQEDFAIYNYYKQFYKEIAPSLKEEISILKQFLSYFENICSKGRKLNFWSWTFIGYNINKNVPDHYKLLCQKMMMDDVDYFKYIEKAEKLNDA